MRQRQHRSLYTADFKADAVRLVFSSDRSLAQIAADLGMNHWTLRGWYREEMKKRKKGGSPPNEQPGESETVEQRAARLEREVRVLRKRVAQLEEDRVILKKAAAFFAKESD
jgi:transposase